MAIQNIGVVGAGTMGNGIAQVCALAGVGVVMVDISTEAVERGLKTVAGSLDRMVKKEKISDADKAAALRVGQRRQPVIGAEDVGRSVDQIEVLLGFHGAVTSRPGRTG